jgi:hypothetical protein
MGIQVLPVAWLSPAHRLVQPQRGVLPWDKLVSVLIQRFAEIVKLIT